MTSKRTSFAFRARFHAALIGCIVTLIWILRLPPFAAIWTAPETLWQDALLRVRVAMNSGSFSPKAAQNIVLVTIDDESSRALGASPPLPRQVYAHLIRSLEDAHADVIAFQIVFDGASKAFQDGRNVPPQLNTYIKQLFGAPLVPGTAADDDAFAEALRNRNNIVLGSQIDHALLQLPSSGSGELLAPDERFVGVLGAGAGIGNMAVEPDRDGIIRHATISGDKFPGHWSNTASFAVRALEKKYKTPAIENDREIFIHGQSIPKSFRIGFSGPAGTFETIPLWKALEWRKYAGIGKSRQVGSFVQDPFAHKIVIVGYKDVVPATVITPLGGARRPMSNAELQANIIASIMDRSFIRDLTPGQELIVMLALTGFFAYSVGFWKGSNYRLILISSTWIMSWAAICAISFIYCGLSLPCIIPNLLIFTTSFCVIWLDENVLQSQRRVREKLGLEGKTAEITVLNCQLFGFDKAIKDLPPAQAIEKANECISTICGIITANGGTIERRLNHGVVAIWGAPNVVPAQSQAKSAAEAACKISQEMKASNLEPAVALAHGTAVCGIMGPMSTSNYSAVGKPIDTASRLIAMSLHMRTPCVVSSATADLLADSDFEIRKLPDSTFQLIGQKGKLPGALEEATTLYRRAMDAMDEGNCEEAERLFESALRLVPDDGPSKSALATCRSFNLDD